MKIIMKDGTESLCSSIYYQHSAQTKNSTGLEYFFKFEKDTKPLEIIKKVDEIFSESNISTITVFFDTEDTEPIVMEFEKMIDASLSVTNTGTLLEVRLLAK